MHTALRSIVVKHLQNIFKDGNSVAITCIYLNYKEQNEQTVCNLIASLLKQIVQDRATISDNVRALYKHHRDRDTRPILDDIIEAMKSEIGLYSKVFIVVDALDECESQEVRTTLLKTLRSFATARNVPLMVTSRDLPSIAQEFEGTARLDIRARDQDLEKYLEGRIAAGPRHLKRLQENIVRKIIQNAAGM
jgi:hypothetical protein